MTSERQIEGNQQNAMKSTAPYRPEFSAAEALGYVLINESWVSGGAPMSAFRGEADGGHSPAEGPLIAISGHDYLGLTQL